MTDFVNPLCLVADAGHTRIKFAACELTAESPLPVIRHSVAVLYDDTPNWNEITRWFEGREPSQSILMGTNLQQARRFADSWPDSLPTPVFFTQKERLPVQIDVEFPEKVGIDRLLKAIAANLLRRPDQVAITIGSGSAVTVDLIDETGVFRGGAILPGILMGAKSLHLETTTLPHINAWDLLKTEPAVLGKNTEQAIASGLFWGHLGGVREIVNRFAEQFSPHAEPLVLVTGGAAAILSPYLNGSQQEDELPLRALAAVADKVCSP